MLQRRGDGVIAAVRQRRTIRLRDIFACCSLILFSLCISIFISSSAVRAGDAPARLEAHGYRMVGDASRVRMLLNFDREPDMRWFALRSPSRLVIDLPETGFAIAPEEAKARGLISDVQYGQMGPGASRIILTTDTPFEVESIEVIKNETSPGYRLVADIVATSLERFEAFLADQALTTAATTTAKTDRLGGAESSVKPFTIVIDPGHGGIDSGARGVSGTLEKSITLAFSLELKKRLEQSGRYIVRTTRDNDVFLRLDERVRIARQQEADLFISVHADTIKFRGIRGATVYTVSDQASDAESAALAARENLSDELAGMAVDDKNHEVSDILMDLIRRETHSFSIRFARTLLGELSGKVELINNPHRFAGFRVLKAPDVPSVLLELGYLSNPDDEEQLRNADWRSRAVDSIAAAVDLFAQARTGARR